MAKGETVTEALGYEQCLRAIGQALEGQGLQSFEMFPVGNDFAVRATAPSAPSSGSLRALWDKLPKFNSDPNPAETSSSAENVAVDLRYTLQDIQQLESAGRARRVDPQRMANAASLSQVLRCLGAYLNQKRARLTRLTREDEAVVLEYESSLGSPMKESFSANGLYDMWVRMYLQRSGRTIAPNAGSES